MKVKREPGASKKASNKNKATANKTKAHREQQKPKKLATEEEDAIRNGKNKLTTKEVFSIVKNLNTIQEYIDIAKHLGEAIFPSQMKEFNKKAPKDQVKRVIKKVQPKYLGFLYNKIAQDCGEKIDPDIMQKPTEGKPKLMSLILQKLTK